MLCLAFEGIAQVAEDESIKIEGAHLEFNILVRRTISAPLGHH